MDTKDVIRRSFGRSQMVTTTLLGDLSDADIMQRPVENANHIAWQLAHLIGALHYFGETLKPGSMPALPEGLAQQYSKETAGSDDPAAFLSKDQYTGLLDQQREAMLQVVDELDESAFLADSPDELKSFAPQIIDLIGLAAEHEMMHSGQISMLRRKLGKPVVF